MFLGLPQLDGFGLPGIILAQTLAYTPIAFLVLIGVVERQPLFRRGWSDLTGKTASGI